MTVLAGSGREGRKEDGRASECSFIDPKGMVVDEATHSCFVADGDSIRKDNIC